MHIIISWLQVVQLVINPRPVTVSDNNDYNELMCVCLLCIIIEVYVYLFLFAVLCGSMLLLHWPLGLQMFYTTTQPSIGIPRYPASMTALWMLQPWSWVHPLAKCLVCKAGHVWCGCSLGG